MTQPRPDRFIRRLLAPLIILVVPLPSVGGTEGDLQVLRDVSFMYAYMEFRIPRPSAGEAAFPVGPTPEHIGQFMQEVGRQNVWPQVRSAVFAIGMDYDPARGFDASRRNVEVLPAERTWRIGLEVAGEPSLKPPLQLAKYSHRRVARVLQVGAYDRPDLAYERLVPYVEEKRLKIVGPPLQRWLDNPAEVAPERCRFEVLLPVEGTQ
jgi:hypothetical protein